MTIWDSWTDSFREGSQDTFWNRLYVPHNKADCYDSMFQKNSPQKKNVFSETYLCFRCYKGVLQSNKYLKIKELRYVRVFILSKDGCLFGFLSSFYYELTRPSIFNVFYNAILLLNILWVQSLLLSCVCPSRQCSLTKGRLDSIIVSSHPICHNDSLN